MVAVGGEFDRLAQWWQQHQDSAIAFAYFVRMNISDETASGRTYQRLLDLSCE